MNLILGLALALVITTGYGIFASVKWATSGARCDARVSAAEAAEATRAREAYAGAIAEAVGAVAESLETTRSEQQGAGEATASRAVQIVRVPVTGACAMPAGLPSLSPAVEEARNAARD
ncbi:hypothetical protein CO641_02365 [Lysobacteraceae bacterium NML91-0213]|nr:hypothetical protein CO641_02365 [Xanthomonadaceae bacterium NML91-0213]